MGSTDYSPIYQGLASAGAAFGNTITQNKKNSYEAELRDYKSGLLNKLLEEGQRSFQPGPQEENPPSGMLPYGDISAETRKSTSRFADVVKSYTDLQKESLPDYKTATSGNDIVAIKGDPQGRKPSAEAIYKGTPKTGTSKLGLSIQAKMQSGMPFEKAVVAAQGDDFDEWLKKQDLTKIGKKEIDDYRQSLRERTMQTAQEFGLDRDKIRHGYRMEELQKAAGYRKTADGKLEFKSWITTGQDDNPYTIKTNDPAEIVDWLNSRLGQIESIMGKLGEVGGFMGYGATTYTKDWQEFVAGNKGISELPGSIQKYAIEYAQHKKELEDFENNKGLLPALEGPPTVDENADTGGDTGGDTGVLQYDVGGDESYTSDELYKSWGGLPQFKGMSRTDFDAFLKEEYGDTTNPK